MVDYVLSFAAGGLSDDKLELCEIGANLFQGVGVPVGRFKCLHGHNLASILLLSKMNLF